MGEYAEFFKFAAKAGALEGYLYEREKIESLSNWVNNMQVMYNKLPADVKKEIKEEYGLTADDIVHAVKDVRKKR